MNCGLKARTIDSAAGDLRQLDDVCQPQSSSNVCSMTSVSAGWM
jgi:hypothetical protein